MAGTTYPQPVKREVPTTLKNSAVDATTAIYNTNNIMTSAVLKSAGGFTLRAGDSFSSGFYDYYYGPTEVGDSWSRNYKGAPVSAGELPPTPPPQDLTPYAKLESPQLVGQPGVPNIPMLSGTETPEQLNARFNMPVNLRYLTSVFGAVGAVLFVTGAGMQGFNDLPSAIAAIPGNGAGGWVYAHIWLTKTNPNEVQVGKGCTIEALAPLGHITVNNNARCIVRGNLYNSRIHCSGGHVSIESEMYFATTGGNALQIFPAGEIVMYKDLIIDTDDGNVRGYNCSASGGGFVKFTMHGNIIVLRKGVPLGAKENIAFFGKLIKSNDAAIEVGPGIHDFYGTTIDMRASVRSAPCMLLTRSNGYGTPQRTTLNAGCALMTAANVPVMIPNNGPVEQYVEMSHTVIRSSNVPLDPRVILFFMDAPQEQYLTSPDGTQFKTVIANDGTSSNVKI